MRISFITLPVYSNLYKSQNNRKKLQDNKDKLQAPFPPKSPQFLINNQPLFKKSLIKKLYLEGKLKLEEGIYGGKLSPKLVSDEHILPKSKGGKNNLGNIALANRIINNKRSNSPLSTVFNKEAFKKYCQTIEEQNLPELKGYVEKLQETVERVLKEGL